MLLSTLASHVQDASGWKVLIAIAALVWIISAVRSALFHPYADIPGPFWAKVSRLWLATQVLRGDLEKKQRDLHRRHGELRQLVILLTEARR